jgi:branched-chain amino acid transport system permease protein
MGFIESLVNFVFLSVSVASVYILVAIGFSITFGSLRFVNMAHGALYLLGGYIGLLVAYEIELGGLLSDYSPVGLGWGFAAALVIVPIVVFVIGILMERLVARQFYDRSAVDQLLITFGILIFIQEASGIIAGRGTLGYDRPGWAAGPIDLPILGSVSQWRLWVVIITAVLLVFLLAFYKYTNFGLVVRAGTQDAEMIRLLGIKLSRPFLLIFAIGAAFAGLAGVLGGSLFSVAPEMGIEILIPALLVVVVGGVGSIRGSIVVGLIFGFSFMTASRLVPDMATASLYIVAIVLLTLKPTGLFGTEEGVP